MFNLLSYAQIDDVVNNICNISIEIKEQLTIIITKEYLKSQKNYEI